MRTLKGHPHLYDCTPSIFCVLTWQCWIIYLWYLRTMSILHSWKDPAEANFFFDVAPGHEHWQAWRYTIICVEQFVSSLFCMHDSQSVIFSLLRSVPVWLCPCWNMAVFIRQDYSQYVMMWCDKNEVHWFFVYLFCCSFESYTWLWLLQQSGALSLVIH